MLLSKLFKIIRFHTIQKVSVVVLQKNMQYVFSLPNQDSNNCLSPVNIREILNFLLYVNDKLGTYRIVSKLGKNYDKEVHTDNCFMCVKCDFSISLDSIN